MNKMRNKKSICCNAEMAFGRQCLVCGADGREPKKIKNKCSFHKDGEHHFIPCDEWSATCQCGKTE